MTATTTTTTTTHLQIGARAVERRNRGGNVPARDRPRRELLRVREAPLERKRDNGARDVVCHGG
jgi:hypothetical protein